MRWHVPSQKMREETWQKKHKNWTRGFAWRPILDYDTRIRYWLCFIWMRGSGEFGYHSCYESWWEGRVPRCPDEHTSLVYRRAETKTFARWEIRGGSGLAPDVKECPRNQQPTVV